MKLHTFLEYKNGEYSVIKKFLHLDGFEKPIKESDKDLEDLFYNVNYFYFLCEDQNKTIKEVAYNYANENNLFMIESYCCEQMNFSNIEEILAVQI